MAFPQDGFLRDPATAAQLEQALALGVEEVGGIPHHETTMAEGAESVRRLCEIAAAHGLPVDMHRDETDDPASRHIETLSHHTRRLGLGGRVTGSHLRSLHSMNDAAAACVIAGMAEAGVAAVANPLINITLQGRHDGYPRRRGMTRVPELLAAGVPVAFGQDCVLDPWYALGSADLLEVASMGLHMAQMTAPAAQRQCFDAVTTTPARILGRPGYGLEPGCRADFVRLQAGHPAEAVRLRATRLLVVRGGRIVARSPAATAELHLPGRLAQVDFCFEPTAPQPANPGGSGARDSLLESPGNREAPPRVDKMKLIGALTSPYVRKVRIVMAEKKLDFQLLLEDVWNSDEILKANPLGKVPCLVMEGGEAVFDSRVIVEYLDALSPVGKLIPPPGRERIEVRTWEALADGLLDASILARLEATWPGRTAEQRSQAWIARQMARVNGSLKALGQGLADKPWCAGTHFTLADIAVGCALGYLDFRFPQIDWRSDHANLKRLADKLAQRQSFVDTLPPTA